MALPNPPDPDILLHGTPTTRQRECVEAWIEHKSAKKAGAALSVDPSQITRAAANVRKKAELAGWSPTMRGGSGYVPGTENVIGRSIYTKDDEGNPIWLKTKAKPNQSEAFEKAIESMCEGIKPFKRVKAPRKTESASLTDYVITDFHLGMYAWHLETGDDWDMEIAEAVLLNSITEMMDGSPDSEVGIFSNIGDLLHWDGLLAVTPMNKHVLDADTRFDLLVESAMNVCEKAVEMLLHKHKQVHVIHAEGNHDPASSSWLRRVTARAFRDNPRVSVETSPFPFYHYQWGETFLGWHHGHLQKMEALPLAFSTEPRFRQDWGRSKFGHVKTGHRHQKEMLEKGGIIVEQFETLAARDAYGARGFPFSQRGTAAVTYEKTRGEVSRVTVRPSV